MLHRNLITINCSKPGPEPTKTTHKIMVIVNARSIVKTAATPTLHAELHSKNIDIYNASSRKHG